MRKLIHFSPHMLEPFHRILDTVAGSVILILLYSEISPDFFATKTVYLALLVAVTTVLSLICFHLAGVYRLWAGADSVSECNRIAVAVFMVFAGLLLMGYVFKVSSIYSRRVIVLTIVAWPVFLCVERVVIKKALFRFLAKNAFYDKAVVAGAGELATSLYDWTDSNPWAGVRIAGYFGSCTAGATAVGTAPCLGNVDDLPAYVRENNIPLVYVVLPMREEAVLNDMLRGLEDTTAQIYYFPEMSIFKHLMGGDVAHVAGQPAIVLRSSPFEGMNGVIKRVEDLLLTLLILVLISPFMLLIAIGIKLSSRGPVLFRQWRYGLGGEPFQIYKFRTMSVLENGYNFTPARGEDPRITRLGLFLRKNSLDELPQFFNVLGGTMSVVGPRPHAVKMNEDYRKHIPGYMLRHISKPGITGLAQVNGCKGEVRTDEDMQKRISFDIAYLQNWSVMLDLKIVFKTVFKLAWRQSP